MIPTKFNKLQFQNNTIIIDWSLFDWVRMPAYIYCSKETYQIYKNLKFKYLALEINDSTCFYNQDCWSKEQYTLDELKQITEANGEDWYRLEVYHPTAYFFSYHGTTPLTNTEIREDDDPSNSFLFGLKYKDQMSPPIINMRYCLTENALILMSDYSQKYIKDIQVGQKILSINQQTGQVQQNIVQFNSKIQNTYFEQYDIWYFEDNHKIQTVNRHRFYNIDRQAFVYIDQWNIGQRVRTIDGKQLKLIKHQVIKERKQAYTIKVKNQTYIANGMFTGTRYAKPITPFDK